MLVPGWNAWGNARGGGGGVKIVTELEPINMYYKAEVGARNMYCQTWMAAAA